MASIVADVAADKAAAAITRLVTERDEAQSVGLKLAERVHELLARAETAEAQRDAALAALDDLTVVMTLEHARTCAARVCDCDLDDTRDHSLRSARAASRAIGGGE
jgi:hypothetical protein